MKYVSDKPIDFTNQDWKQHTPREGARLEARREEEEKRKRALARKKSGPRILLEWALQIGIVILFAYVAVYIFGQTRTNVGQSMDPTLSGGDTLLINIFSYQMNGPSQGDIISYKPNGSTNAHSDIKRVIGLPGQTIQIKDGMIYIDGKVYLEGADYPAITSPGLAAEPIRLKDRQYFVLGDNRNNSEDSRSAEIGVVTSDMIEGRAWFVLSPAEHRRFL